MSKRKDGPIINFLLKNKLAENITGANAILIVIALVNLSLAALVIQNTYFPKSAEATYLEDIPQEIRKTLPPEILNGLPSKNAQ